MFNTFTAALLAAVTVAKGLGDGSSQDNAVSTVLIDDPNVKLVVNSYNSNNAGTYEAHGDLTLT